MHAFNSPDRALQTSFLLCLILQSYTVSRSSPLAPALILRFLVSAEPLHTKHWYITRRFCFQLSTLNAFTWEHPAGLMTQPSSEFLCVSEMKSAQLKSRGELSSDCSVLPGDAASHDRVADACLTHAERVSQRPRCMNISSLARIKHKGLWLR